MIEIVLTFTDGSTETIKCSRCFAEDGVLVLRISHSTAYTETWKKYPLTSLRCWERK